MAVYQCGKCGKVVRNSTTPQNSTICEGKQFHSWTHGQKSSMMVMRYMNAANVD
jgi:hypothetical protein